MISNHCEIYFNIVETGLKNTIYYLYHLAIRDIVNLVIIIEIKINTSYRDPGHVPIVIIVLAWLTDNNIGSFKADGQLNTLKPLHQCLSRLWFRLMEYDIRLRISSFKAFTELNKLPGLLNNKSS